MFAYYYANMKTITRITFFCFLVSLSAVAAFAQARSITSVPDDAEYHSKEDGFTISLPANAVKKGNLSEAGATGRSYIWEFSDAAIAIGVEVRAKPAKTDAEVEAVIANYKATKLKHDKILSESPASIGDYEGVTFVTERDGAKSLIVFLVYEKFVVVLLGTSESKSPDVQQAIAEAIKSFEFEAE